MATNTTPHHLTTAGSDDSPRDALERFREMTPEAQLKMIADVRSQYACRWQEMLETMRNEIEILSTSDDLLMIKQITSGGKHHDVLRQTFVAIDEVEAWDREILARRSAKGS